MDTGHEYTTGDFTYKYLPEAIEPESDIANTLDEAVKYKTVRVIKVSPNLWKYLKKTFHITPEHSLSVQPKPLHYSYIYKHKEGLISVIIPSMGYITLVLFNGKGSLDRDFYKEVFKAKDKTGNRKGLQYLLDPNHGGSIDEDNIDIANMIMFG